MLGMSEGYERVYCKVNSVILAEIASFVPLFVLCRLYHLLCSIDRGSRKCIKRLSLLSLFSELVLVV